MERDAEGKPVRYCIDAATEQTLQQQRKLAMIASGVLLFAAWKMRTSWWLRVGVGAIGIGLYYANSSARQAILTTEKLQ